MPLFTLRFPADEIAAWAARYDASIDAEVEGEVGPFMRREGYLTRDHFLTLARWKSPRPGPLCARNEPGFVETVTRAAVATTDERFRIEVLRLLQGVDWPTASAILHLGSTEPYPLLDVRALWSLGHDTKPPYTFDLWWAYTTFTRGLAEAQGVSMRTLDRALWKFSEDHQGRLTPAAVPAP